MIYVLVLLIAIGAVGYVYIMKVKNETFIYSDLADINEKPIMPTGTNTSFFLTKDKELKSMNAEKVGDFSIDNIAYRNYHVGYYLEEKNVYIVISQNIPNKIQKFLGLYDMPYISIYSVFNDGSDLESTTRKFIEKEDKSDYRRVNAYDDLPIDMIIPKHLVKVDLIETKGIEAIELTKDNFYKHMKRGLKIDLVHFSTKGYETKQDIERIFTDLGLKKEKEEDNNKAED